jgi:hypothetical protein
MLTKHALPLMIEALRDDTVTPGDNASVAHPHREV